MADDASGVLLALSRLEVLLRACPDELEQVAPELVRALMHCRLPDWAEAEAKRWGGAWGGSLPHVLKAA